MTTAAAQPSASGSRATSAWTRLSQMLPELVALGLRAEGDLGSAHPLEAMEKALAVHQFDEIIVATLPRHLSRWLRAGLPHRAERRFGLPVTLTAQVWGFTLVVKIGVTADVMRAYAEVLGFAVPDRGLACCSDWRPRRSHCFLA